MNEPILAVDVGGGTQDIVLYDPEQPMENAVKLVLPSPTVVIARRIRRVTAMGKSLFLSGRLMGGGAVAGAIRKHIAAGLDVFSLPGPALTINDNADKVAAVGVRIVDQRPDGDAVEVVMGDLDLEALGRALALFETPLPKRIAVALQDHGFSPDFSNRLTRFGQWRRFLESGGDVGELLFKSPPESLTRWMAALEAAPGALFMDTAAAALRGAMLDDEAAGKIESGLTIVNAGNEHTVAFLLRGREVFGVYEHHTSILTPEALKEEIGLFMTGGLPHERVFDEGGHGVAYRRPGEPLGGFDEVVVTGPRRALAASIGRMAAPYGEMMLSGCFGLIEAVREKNGDRRP